MIGAARAGCRQGGILVRGRTKSGGLRPVSSTSLSAAFNGRPVSPKPRPRGGGHERTGLFLLPQLAEGPGGFVRLRDECAHKAGQLVSEAMDPGRGRIVASVFDDLSDELCRVADMAEFVRLAHPDGKVAAAAEEACIAVSGMVEQLNTHTGLYG